MDALATRTLAVRTNGARGGRRNRVVLAPLGWCQVCGLMILQTTVTNKSWTPGRSRISRKSSRREGRIAPSSPVVPSPCFFLHGGRGCGGHPAFPAPSDAEGSTQAKLRTQIAPRECLWLSKQVVGWVELFAKPIIFASRAMMGIAPLHPSYTCGIEVRRPHHPRTH